MMERLNQTCIILGANSDLGRALAIEFAKQGYDLVLAVRRYTDDLHSFESHLKTDLSVQASVVLFDGVDVSSHDRFWDRLAFMPDILISTIGYLGDEELAKQDAGEQERIRSVNYIGPVSLINGFIQRVNGIKPATIIGISSVAGDRIRPSNYFYGSAKAAFTNYLNVLRSELTGTGIQIMTVKPGYIRTKMIAHLSTPRMLTASPESAARYIFRAFQQKRNIVYVYPVWRWIMAIIQCIPEFIFKRLSI